MGPSLNAIPSASPRATVGHTDYLFNDALDLQVNDALLYRMMDTERISRHKMALISGDTVATFSIDPVTGEPPASHQQSTNRYEP